MEFPWWSAGWQPGSKSPARAYVCNEHGDYVYLGEDNYFCKKAQKHGFDIYLDTRIKSPHLIGNASHPPEWHPFDEKQQAFSPIRVTAEEMDIEELLRLRLGMGEGQDDAT
jgi:hypothetical protein